MGYESVSEEEESDDENDQPVRFFHKYERLLKNLLVLFLYIAIGVIFMMTHEKTRFVTSLYIITQIVTTIGYGDITMKSDEGKLFMTLYVLCGIVFIAGIINDAVNSQLADQEADLRDRLLAARVSKKDGSKPTPSRWKAYKLYKLSASLTIFAFFTFSWTAFFATFESCSCSYGKSAVSGCTETNCASTGAQKKNWLEAFYMAVVTMTTVGFGDFTPQSQTGRALGSVWMLFGVLATANMVNAVGVTMAAIAGKGQGGRIHRQAMTEKMFKTDRKSVV